MPKKQLEEHIIYIYSFKFQEVLLPTETSSKGATFHFQALKKRAHDSQTLAALLNHVKHLVQKARSRISKLDQIGISKITFMWRSQAGEPIFSVDWVMLPRPHTLPVESKRWDPNRLFHVRSTRDNKVCNGPRVCTIIAPKLV